jgi:hypothetical protein
MRRAGLVVAVSLAAACGGRARLEDRTTAPAIPASAVEKVADLDYPPGNIAVSSSGRVFFTLHPDGAPPAQVHELRDGKAVPYPSASFADYQSVLALRIDSQNRPGSTTRSTAAGSRASSPSISPPTGSPPHDFRRTWPASSRC